MLFIIVYKHGKIFLSEIDIILPVKLHKHLWKLSECHLANFHITVILNLVAM